MVRPFQFGDIFLVQRLGRQAAKLNIVQATLHRQSALGASLTSVFPWNHAKVITYILRQKGNQLAGNGFLQVQKRPGRPELDIVRLAPGLDAQRGHPAIWVKLLSYHAYEVAHRHIERIYADVPDQPLPVKTFVNAGFRTYDRLTLWRLHPRGIDDYSSQLSADFRPQGKADEWALEQLYRRVVPKAVQAAEGMQNGASVRPPILDWWHGGSYSNYVLVESGEIRGTVQIAQGSRGWWLQLWTDFTDPDTDTIHQLVRFALTTISRRSSRLPVYIAVREYHGALGNVLAEYNFAPVTDRAKMVKHVFQWLRETVPVNSAALETTPPVATAPFDLSGNCRVQQPQIDLPAAEPVTPVCVVPPEGAAPSSRRKSAEREKRLALEHSFG